VLAEGEGFEPPVPFEHGGFQDRCLKPLGQPSSKACSRVLALIGCDALPDCVFVATCPCGSDGRVAEGTGLLNLRRV
jgi:hypothetical protein